MPERKLAAPVVAATLFAVALAGSCAQQKMQSSLQPAGPSPKFAATSYINEGRVFRFLVEVRAARLLGPTEFLGLMVAFENTTQQLWTINRESFVLELPDGTTLPLMSYAEYEKDYRRERSDLRATRPFFESMAGRYPQPPFMWIPLDFFPVKNSTTFPREDVQGRTGQLIHGFIYFRLPTLPEKAGRYKLLLKPREYEETFVVDFEPYQESKNR
jgi:hypothetical protein